MRANERRDWDIINRAVDAVAAAAPATVDTGDAGAAGMAPSSQSIQDGDGNLYWRFGLSTYGGPDVTAP